MVLNGRKKATAAEFCPFLSCPALFWLSAVLRWRQIVCNMQAESPQIGRHSQRERAPYQIHWNRCPDPRRNHLRQRPNSSSSSRLSKHAGSPQDWHRGKQAVSQLLIWCSLKKTLSFLLRAHTLKKTCCTLLRAASYCPCALWLLFRSILSCAWFTGTRNDGFAFNYWRLTQNEKEQNQQQQAAIPGVSIFGAKPYCRFWSSLLVMKKLSKYRKLHPCAADSIYPASNLRTPHNSQWHPKLFTWSTDGKNGTCHFMTNLLPQTFSLSR